MGDVGRFLNDISDPASTVERPAEAVRVVETSMTVPAVARDDSREVGERSMANEVSDLVREATAVAEKLGVARMLRRVVGELHTTLIQAGQHDAARIVFEWQRKVGSEEGV